MVEPLHPKNGKRKKFTNDNISSDEDAKSHNSPRFQEPLEKNLHDKQRAQASSSMMGNSRRLLTAPDFVSRKRFSQRNQTVIGSALYQPFIEKDFLKSTNIYQQFDKKTNLYENRLYAKTSINQAKYHRD